MPVEGFEVRWLLSADATWDQACWGTRWVLIFGLEERWHAIHVVRVLVVKSRHKARSRRISIRSSGGGEKSWESVEKELRKCWSIIATGLFTKWAGFWSLGRSPWLWRRLVRRARWWLSEPRRSRAEDFGVGGTVNFLKKGIQSLGNFGFQGSHSLRCFKILCRSAVLRVREGQCVWVLAMLKRPYFQGWGSVLHQK